MSTDYKSLTIRISKETHKEVKWLCELFKENQSELFRRLVTERYIKLSRWHEKNPQRESLREDKP